MELAPAAHDAAALLVNCARRQQPQSGGAGGGGAAELEARFGDCTDEGGFSSSVSSRFFYDALHACEAWTGWGRVDDWSTSVDFYFEHGGELIRTTRAEDGGVTHLAKTSLARRVFRLEHDDPAHDVPHALRISVAAEREKSADELPTSAFPSKIRDKTRKSFTSAAWRFDFTRVFDGATRADIDAARREGRERFEIELECVGLDMRMSSSDEHIASSMLMKMTDFLLFSATRCAVCVV